MRGQLACTAKRLPAADALPIIERLVAHDADLQDPYLPLLLWWAVEKHAVSAREAVLALFTRPDVWKLPLVHEAILERLMRRYAAESSRRGYLALRGCSTHPRLARRGSAACCWRRSMRG